MGVVLGVILHLHSIDAFSKIGLETHHPGFNIIDHVVTCINICLADDRSHLCIIANPSADNGTSG